MSVVMVEIEVTSPGGVLSTLRFCDRPIRPFPPTDADRPNLAWDDRLSTAPSISRTLFDDLENLTPGYGVGTLDLANGDGALNAYQGHAWGEVRVYLYDDGAFSDGGKIMKARAEVPNFSANTNRPGRVTLGFHDGRIVLDDVLQDDNYSGVGTYEGTPTDLKGTPKPLAYGRLDGAHVPAPLVNAGVKAYQLHDGAIQGTLQIFDRGADAGLAGDGDQSTNAGFDAASPAAAHYVTQFNRGLVKFNSSPVGDVTFGFRGDAAGGYVETAGPIMQRLLMLAGVPATSINASVANFPSTAVVGIYQQSSGTARDAINRLARSVAASVLPRPDGAWVMKAITPPAAVADYTIAFDEIVSVDGEEDTPAPVGVVRVGYSRLFRTFSRTELLSSITGAAAAALGKEYKHVFDYDTAARQAYPQTARKLFIDTDLRLEADAIALAANLKVLFGLRADGKPRRRWRVVLELTKRLLSTVDLSSTIRLTYPAAGVDDNFLLIGVEPLRPKSSQLTWTLWG